MRKQPNRSDKIAFTLIFSDLISSSLKFNRIYRSRQKNIDPRTISKNYSEFDFNEKLKNKNMINLGQPNQNFSILLLNIAQTEIASQKFKSIGLPPLPKQAKVITKKVRYKKIIPYKFLPQDNTKKIFDIFVVNYAY